MEDEGLLRAIIAQPDDDVPRLVYADWLEDHARPECARLIRAQCEFHQPQRGGVDELALPEFASPG